jgi:hypothetical protein
MILITILNTKLQQNVFVRIKPNQTTATTALTGASRRQNSSIVSAYEEQMASPQPQHTHSNQPDSTTKNVLIHSLYLTHKDEEQQTAVLRIEPLDHFTFHEGVMLIQGLIMKELIFQRSV